MIEVGLTSVADHPDLAARGKQSSLSDLAQYFPVVELDTTFYQIPSQKVVRGWQDQVPKGFRFIVKATQYMTLHREMPPEELIGQFTALKQALAPLGSQLAAVFFQFPPYFGVTAKNVRYLNWVRRQYPDLPLAIEFRNSGWYAPAYRQSTLDLLKQLAWIHVIADEPQTAAASVPLVAKVTNSDETILRLHGRNAKGWQQAGSLWRSERTNYHYSMEELAELSKIVQQLQSKRVTVIFNNNGHHDAAKNALQFIQMNQLQFKNLAPRQLNLF